jgi:very-short-patch-repair endonuclease
VAIPSWGGRIGTHVARRLVTHTVVGVRVSSRTATRWRPSASSDRGRVAGMSGRTHPLDTVPWLRALAEAQLFVVRRDQLAALGVTHAHVRRQVDAERWTTYGPHTVVLTTGALSRPQWRAVAVSHAGPRSVLTGRAALEQLGLEAWQGNGIDVLMPRGLRPTRLRRVLVHQTGELDEHDIAPWVWPPCATAARAAVDAASWEGDARTASGLVLAAVQQRLTTPVDILDVLDRRRRVRHRALLVSMMDEAIEGADARSEVDVVRLLRRVGLGSIRRQHAIETPDGVRHVDLVVDLPDGRTLAIEIDGVHHADAHVREADAVKDAALVAAGYVVLRIPASMVRRSAATVLAQLRAIAGL